MAKKPNPLKDLAKDSKLVYEVAIELLCHSLGKEASGRTVGWPYDIIEAEMHLRFSKSKMKNLDLRWYAHQIRLGDEPRFANRRLPQLRPRRNGRPVKIVEET